MNNKNTRYAIIAVLLTIPIIGLFIAHYFHAVANGYVPTGFFQYDMPYYLANAHQYADGQHNGIAYSNPYDFHENSPRIYFHLLLFLYGILLYLDFLDPGVIYVVSGLLFAGLSFFYLQKLIEEYCPGEGTVNALMTLIVAWGGGLLVLFGALASAVKGTGLQLFYYDPFDGWWFLNFGRNFVYATEGFYHLLVVLLLLAVFRKKTISILVLTWLLALTHPFTGVQYSLIIACWIAFEKYFLGSDIVSKRFSLLFFMPVIFCVLYSLVFLSSFPSHQALMAQMAWDWSMKLTTMIGAYSLVAIPVLFRIRNSKKFMECFQDPFNRFLAVCTLISFLLANHEFFMSRPMQPLHFTRGHIWMPLYLLALPVFIDVFRRISQLPNALVRVMCATVLVFVLLSDNFIWFTDKYAFPPDDINVGREDFEIIDYLKTRDDQPIVIFENLKAGYLTATYTSARPYLGHWGGNTPHTPEKITNIENLFVRGTEPEELRGRYYLVITGNFKAQIEQTGRYREIHSANGISVYETTSGNSKS